MADSLNPHLALLHKTSLAGLGPIPFALHVAIAAGVNTRERLCDMFGIGSDHTIRKHLDTLISSRYCREYREAVPYKLEALFPADGDGADDEEGHAEMDRTEGPDRTRFRCRDGHPADSQLERTVDDHLQFMRIRHRVHVRLATLIPGWKDAGPNPASVDFHLYSDGGEPSKTLVEAAGSDPERTAAKAERLRVAGYRVLLVGHHNLYNVLDGHLAREIKLGPFDAVAHRAFEEKAKYRPPPPKPCSWCGKLPCVCEGISSDDPEFEALADKEMARIMAGGATGDSSVRVVKIDEE